MFQQSLFELGRTQHQDLITLAAQERARAESRRRQREQAWQHPPSRERSRAKRHSASSPYATA